MSWAHHVSVILLISFDLKPLFQATLFIPTSFSRQSILEKLVVIEARAICVRLSLHGALAVDVLRHWNVRGDRCTPHVSTDKKWIRGNGIPHDRRTSLCVHQNLTLPGTKDFVESLLLRIKLLRYVGNCNCLLGT